MKTTLIAATIAISTPAVALDFKGIEFGASREQAKEAIPAFNCPPEKPERKGKTICAISMLAVCLSDFKNTNHPCHQTASDALTYAGRPVSKIIASFSSNRLMSVSVHFEPSEFDAISSAMKEKYGKPSNSDEHVVQNRYGAKYKNERYIWATPGGMVSVDKYFGKIDESAVTLTSNEHIAEMAAERAEKSKTIKTDM